jgi:hypothetical protein
MGLGNTSLTRRSPLEFGRDLLHSPDLCFRSLRGGVDLTEGEHFDEHERAHELTHELTHDRIARTLYPSFRRLT